ncbi:serine/threonine-protein kinase, partial [Actinomadura rubrisoli]
MPGRAGELISGRYRLLAPLGQGGMGVVWLARDELLHREVAVKQVKPPDGLPEQARTVQVTRAEREARAAARLVHPGIVTIFDVTEHDGAPVIVMELIKGRSLADIIDQDGPCTPQRAARIGIALLDALRTAHEAGIVHRDLKPANVLITDRRTVITDFGVAALAGDPSITQSGTVLGTPAYMAPEQAQGGNVGPAADLWALGATLYTAVEGHPPFVRDTFVAILSAQMTQPPDPMTKAGPLAPLLTALLQHDPTARATAAQTAQM